SIPLHGLTPFSRSLRVRPAWIGQAVRNTNIVASSSYSGDRSLMTTPDIATLEKVVEKAFDERDQITVDTRGETREAVEEALNLLDSGKVRVAERQDDGTWRVNQWLKKA